MQYRVRFLYSLLFLTVVWGFFSCASKQKSAADPAQDISADALPAPVDAALPVDAAPKEGIVPVPVAYSPTAVPEAAAADPNLPIATLMNMYYQEFKTELWLMTRFTVYSGQFSTQLYNGSLLIDGNLNATALQDKSTQIDVVHQIKEEKRLIVYYSHRYLGGTETAESPLGYFRMDLTSPSLFALTEQKRRGVMGFEIGVVEVPYAEIVGLK